MLMTSFGGGSNEIKFNINDTVCCRYSAVQEPNKS